MLGVGIEELAERRQMAGRHQHFTGFPATHLRFPNAADRGDLGPGISPCLAQLLQSVHSHAGNLSRFTRKVKGARNLPQESARIAYSGPMLGVITALLDVLEEARTDAGRNFSHVSANLESGEGETVIRRLENRNAAPTIDKLDDRVNAYSLATGIPPTELWARAISRANQEYQRELQAAAEAEARRLGEERGQQ